MSAVPGIALVRQLLGASHDAVEHECEKADQRMCADAVRQPVMNGCDFDVGLQNAETALDIGQRFVVFDGFGGREIGCAGQQCQLSVKEFGTHDGLFIKVPAKTIRLQVRLDELAQFRFGDGSGKVVWQIKVLSGPQ